MLDILTKITSELAMVISRKYYRQLERETVTAKEQSRKLVLKIVRDNANTIYGKAHDFGHIHSVAEYQKKVPLSDYADYEPYIERMLAGERGLITSYPLDSYAQSAGTLGKAKMIPISKKQMGPLRRALAFLYAVPAVQFHREGKPTPTGRTFMAWHVAMEEMPDGYLAGCISECVLKNFHWFFPILMTSPLPVIAPKHIMDTDMKYLELRFALAWEDTCCIASQFASTVLALMHYLEKHWTLLCDDIERGIISESVAVPDAVRASLQKYLTPLPERAAALRQAFQAGFDTPIIPRIWPNVAFLSAIGGGALGNAIPLLRAYSGDLPINSFAYAASEAAISSALEMDTDTYVLTPTSGFFEFLPVGDESGKTFELDELEVGRHYELVLTNLSGLYRYRLHDVVQVVGYHNAAPLLRVLYRERVLVNMLGEKVNEADLRYATEALGRATDCVISDACMYGDENAEPMQYVLLLEPAEPVPPKKRSGFQAILEEALEQINSEYHYRIQTGELQPLSLKLLQRGTNERYREIVASQQKTAQQIKPVRVLDTPKKIQFFMEMVEDETALCE